jgi:hypothetical protein
VPALEENKFKSGLVTAAWIGMLTFFAAVVFPTIFIVGIFGLAYISYAPWAACLPVLLYLALVTADIVCLAQRRIIVPIISTAIWVLPPIAGLVIAIGMFLGKSYSQGQEISDLLFVIPALLSFAPFIVFNIMGIIGITRENKINRKAI